MKKIPPFARDLPLENIYFHAAIAVLVELDRANIIC